MDKRSLVLYLSGLAAAGAVVGLAASCSDQPRIKCTAGHGLFAVVYTPVGADPCGANGLPGEEIGVEAYNDALPDKSNLDPNVGSLGMQAVDMGAGDRADTNPAHKAYALGKWGSAEPTPDNFCAVVTPNDIEQEYPFVPAGPMLPDGGPGSAAVPALSVKYTWTNVRFYNSPAAPGTQLVADLTYTRNEGTATGGPGTPCTAQYHVVGLWPSIPCGDDDDPTKTDATKCSPEPDLTKNRPMGSGIGPDLATRCDENLHLCVLARDPPSFK